MSQKSRLRLDGIHADFLRPIFAPTQNALALRNLFLRIHSPLTVAPLEHVFRACKNLEELKLFATGWFCEVVSFSSACVSCD